MFKIIQTPFHDLHNYNESLNEMDTGLLDGIIVRNALSKEKIESIADKFWKFNDNNDYSDLLIPAPFGDVFGTSLMEDDLQTYFKNSKRIWGFLNLIFDQSFDSIVCDLLNPISGKSEILPSIKSDNTLFSPASIRICKPGNSDLNAHVHREFPLHFSSYQEIAKIVDLNTELSFYFQISKPYSGGQLMLYDLTWDNTSPELISPALFLSDRRNQDLELIDKTEIKLEPGDAIIFAANRIWHKVSSIPDKGIRLTVGGFIARSKINENWHYFI